MIIWINGPFGAGKTTLAKRLRDRRSKSLIFDPEEIGFVVKETVPMRLVYNRVGGGQPAALGRVMSYLPAANSVTVQPSATSSGNASRTRWRRLRMVEPLASDGQT